MLNLRDNNCLTVASIIADLIKPVYKIYAIIRIQMSGFTHREFYTAER